MTEKVALKVALVTGASRGIGAEIAAKLSVAGYFTVGTSTTDEGAGNITKRLAGKGAGAVLDVSDVASVNNCLKKVTDQYGTPLVLVNNAGITKDNLLMRMRPEEWDDVISTNLSSVYRLTKGVVRGMIKARWGRVVNISSVVARMGNPGQSNYVTAKAGLEGFTRALALELASRNITVNAVAPGFIDTDMTATLSAEQKEALLQMIPAGRMGTPEEVAELVAFLCSDSAAYITAATLPVNGGLGAF